MLDQHRAKSTCSQAKELPFAGRIPLKTNFNDLLLVGRSLLTVDVLHAVQCLVNTWWPLVFGKCPKFLLGFQNLIQVYVSIVFNTNSS